MKTLQCQLAMAELEGYSIRNREIKLPRIPTTKPDIFIEIKVSYSKGGINWFTHKTEPRGYWLHVTPIVVNGPIVTYTAFSGYKHLVDETKRYSVKGLTTAIAKDETQKWIDTIIPILKDDGYEIRQ